MEVNDSYEAEEYLDEEVLILAPPPISADHSEIGNFDTSGNISSKSEQPDGSGGAEFVPAAETSDDQMNEAGGDPLSSTNEEDLFSFKGIFYQRFFRSQLRPKEMTRNDIRGETTQDVLSCIWQTAKDYVRREVIFRDDVPGWCEKVQPDVDDIERFVTLQDKARKKGYAITDLKHRTLSKWRGKPIYIYVYTYSTNVETNGQYQCLLRKLVTPETPDRSGAHSTRDDAALANELRDKHPHLEGHFSSWLLWANLINSSPAHERDQLKQSEAPPVDIARYFRWAPVSEAARLQSVHRGMVVANTINEGWMRGIADVKNDLGLAFSILQGAIEKLKALESRGHFGSEICSALETTMRPEETELSKNLSAGVIDCEDIDHK